MNHRFLASLFTLTAVAAVTVLSPIQAAGQGGLAAVEKAAASLAPSIKHQGAKYDGRAACQYAPRQSIYT